jgi:hypothetical protein
MSIADDIIKRQMYIGRYIDRLAADSISLTSKTDKAILSLISAFEEVATQRDRLAISKGGVGSRLAQQLLKDISAALTEQGEHITESLSADIIALVEKEIKHTSKLVDTEAPDPSKTSLLVSGSTLSTSIAMLITQHKSRLISVLSETLKAGNDAIKAIKGTVKANYKDGINNKRNNHLASITDYFAQGAVNNARNDVYQSAGIKAFDWVATLDLRACSICANNELSSPYSSATVPSIGHPRCRCVIVPNIEKSTRRPYVKDSRSVKEIPKDERDGKIGVTRKNFKQWFETLNESDKREWLGKSRYEMYKAGKIDIKDLAAGNPKRILTLKEL